MQFANLEQKFKSKDKQKKLLIKKVMVWTRQGFNQRNIGFHPFLLCTSIKPGAQKRHATLQSYPNAELWKSLSGFSQEKIKEYIQMEIILKLDQLQSFYDSSIINEFKKRVYNNFDFAFLYKEQEENQEEQIVNFDVPNVQMTSQFDLQEREESESKSLLKQVELCNSRKGSIVSFENTHYHKLCQFLEKIQKYIDQSSIELHQFYQGLQQFLESQQILFKKIKIELQEKEVEPQEEAKQEQEFNQQQIKRQQNNTNQNQYQQVQLNQQSQSQQIKKQMKSKEELLDEIKLDALKLQPGLALFLPDYDKILPEDVEKVREIENSFFTEISCWKILNPEQYTPKQILIYWRTVFEPKIQKPIHFLPMFQLDIMKQE